MSKFLLIFNKSFPSKCWKLELDCQQHNGMLGKMVRFYLCLVTNELRSFHPKINSQDGVLPWVRLIFDSLNILTWNVVLLMLGFHMSNYYLFMLKKQQIRPRRIDGSTIGWNDLISYPWLQRYRLSPVITSKLRLGKITGTWRPSGWRNSIVT